jgi:hypothetical protein
MNKLRFFFGRFSQVLFFWEGNGTTWISIWDPLNFLLFFSPSIKRIEEKMVVKELLEQRA